MKIVSVDTGNRLIKTPHFSFNAGIVRHGKRPPAIKTDMLYFGGEYFTITEQRTPYLRDKTVDDTYYLLTLIAIGKELQRLYPNKMLKVDEKVYLAVGLPPSHLPVYKDSFAQYFLSKGDKIDFQYNDQRFSIEISRVVVYPQGFSAAADILEQVKMYPMSYVVDIGGYTTDVVLLSNGKPDMSFCHSFNFGVIHMDNDIKRVVSAQHDVELEDAHVEATLMGNGTLPPAIQRTVREEARRYADNLIRNLKEKNINPAINMLIFIGGGAELFKDVLSESCPNTIFKDKDGVRANAIGYAKLASASMGLPYAG